ncbi:MAG: LolA family protein [Anaerobacillus sp.]|uniref:LolA family protein n=1 Tax=Anaerobacillus sp. TaxID=1872506 RepID=UPI00391B3A1B
MKKITSIIFSCILLLGLLAACSEKTQEDIIAELGDKIKNMTGYKAEAVMSLDTGKDSQQYNVEIWHKQPSYFRVALNNANKDQSQIILRNDEGVFVLTPALNKSFRFQSDWPDNNSQVYLYESLVNDILMDPERTFTATDDHYIFETKTNYANKNLQQQEITLSKKDLSPVSAKIKDVDLNVLVTVEFNDFEFNPNFNDGDFDMDRNMTGAQLESLPAMAQESEEPLVPTFPMYIPDGTVLNDSKEVNLEDGEGKRIILSFTGDKNFTLIQEKSRVQQASIPMNISSGEPVDLGFTIGALSSEGQISSLKWSYDGVDFFLASKDLSQEEMSSIARSVYGTHVK